MSKQEFNRRMERARSEVLEDDEQGVCCAILNSFIDIGSPDVADIFTQNFEGDFLAGYFLDDFYNPYDNMTQLERRLVFLESFKGFCEAYKLYESW